MAELTTPDAVRDLKPGEKWWPTRDQPVAFAVEGITVFNCQRGRPEFYIECEGHAKGRAFVVVGL